MNRRFSAQELFDLRNRIPIETLIQKKLKLPSKIREGFFRFLCPVCRGFHTAVNRQTNLARCFYCETSFNTIDLVMVVKGTKFVESVKYLKELSLNGPSRDVESEQTLGEMIRNIGNFRV